MKRILLVTVIAVMLLTLFSCSPADDEGGVSGGGKVTVATTTFAAYDWVRAVAGDRNVEITLVGGGADLHSYDPTAEDILTVSQCSLLIHTGGESDSWVSDVTRTTGSRTINMTEAIGDNVYHVHSHGNETDTPDEHIWLSFNNAQIIIQQICNALSTFDSAGAVEYDDNREKYALRLSALDRQYREAVGQYTLPSVIVADRFAIAYMLREYGIAWYAALSGCSADVEVSFNTVTQMAAVIDRLDASYVIVTENDSVGIASTVIDSTKAKTCKTVVINTMQSASTDNDYLDIMTKNLDSLKLALLEDTE